MRHNPQPYRPRGPIGLVAAAALVACLLVAGLVAIFYREWLLFSTNNPLVVELIRFIVFASVPSILVGGIVMALQIAWRRYGWRESIAAHYAVLMKRAEVQAAPMATSYHQHIETTAAPALALPEPIEQIEVIKPMADWMAWVDDQPHTLLGGKTRAGKTWLATALLERRIDSGCDIFIIDPHSSDWMGLPTAGGSGIPERKAAIKAVLSEYLRRMGLREEHKRRTGRELPHDFFDPLVVMIDESNAMLEELAAEWRTVLKQVASGSRKVGITLLLLAQSPLVEDLGISGAMRENFSRIALDDRTVQALIDSERDKARKAALQAAFKTMDRPAAAQIGPQVWLLDRRGLSPGNASSGARIWAGWDFDNGCQVSSNSPQHAVTEPLSNPAQFDDDVAEAVISPGAGVAPVITVSLSAAEIANIATLLMSSSPSEAAKKVNGYNGRNYREMKQKVETVKNLMEGTKQ